MAYERVTALIPRMIRDVFKRELSYLDLPVTEKRFLGFIFSFSIAISLALALNAYFFFNLSPILSFFSIFLLATGGTYAWLYFSSSAKGQFIELILPDTLQLIAANLSAGLTMDKALLVAARKEFGPLERELKRVSTRIISGTSTVDALMEMPKRVRSSIFEKTVWLMAKGIESGGELSSLLIQLSEDLRRRYAVQQEVKANVSVYILLIFFAAIVAAPVLIGISTFIVQVTVARVTALQIPAALPTLGEGTLIAPGLGVSIEFVELFSVTMVFISALFSGLTLGIITRGRESEGVKFLPFLIVMALFFFFAVKWVLSIFFAGIL
jgi:hypothetical protein